jgi:hypothetical protein
MLDAAYCSGCELMDVVAVVDRPVSQCTTSCPPDASSRSRPSIALLSYVARKEAPRQTVASTYDMTSIVARTMIRLHDNTTIIRHCLVDEAVCRYIFGSTEKTAQNELETILPRGGGGRLRWSLLSVERRTTIFPTMIPWFRGLGPPFARILTGPSHACLAIFSDWTCLQRFHSAVAQGLCCPWDRRRRPVGSSEMWQIKVGICCANGRVLLYGTTLSPL